MHVHRRCPECGFDARWVATAIEYADRHDESDLVETETYYCPECGKFWDVRTPDSGTKPVHRFTEFATGPGQEAAAAVLPAANL